MGRVMPRRVFGSVKKRKESRLLRAVREAAKDAAIVRMTASKKYDPVSAMVALEALSHPIWEDIGDPVSVPLEEVEAKRSRHGYGDVGDRRERDAVRALGEMKMDGVVSKSHVGASKDALEFAAHYLASVVCEFNGHRVPAPDWPYEFPCKLCFGWALDTLHALAIHRFPIKEHGHGGTKEGKKRGGKVRAESRGKRRHNRGE